MVDERLFNYLSLTFGRMHASDTHHFRSRCMSDSVLGGILKLLAVTTHCHAILSLLIQTIQHPIEPPISQYCLIHESVNYSHE
jgi:hypothetical protein